MSTVPRLKRREKMFGEGRLMPLDRNAKARIMVFARALSRRTEEGKHYGIVTAKFLAVLDALLWGFHNAHSGRCFPSYERIAERADCARSTVYEAITALERVGILTWVNRIARIREWGPDLFGRAQNRVRVIRTSNAYTFIDPKPCAKPSDSSKFDFPTGTEGQDFKKEGAAPNKTTLDPESALHRALMRLESAMSRA
jgi:Helix-turn-helix domain